MKMDKTMYNAVQVSKITGIKYGTVWARFNSRYAYSRWGVVDNVLLDGSIKQFVPKEKIHLWLEGDNFVGRPTNEELKELEE